MGEESDDDIHDFDAYNDLTLAQIANGILNDDVYHYNPPHNIHWNDDETQTQHKTNSLNQQPTLSSVFKFAAGTDLNPKAKEWNQVHLASPSSSATSNSPFHSIKPGSKTLLSSANNTPSFPELNESEVPSIPSESPLSVDVKGCKSASNCYSNSYPSQQQQSYAQSQNQNANAQFVSPQSQYPQYTQQQHANYSQARYGQQNTSPYSQYQQYTQYQPQRYGSQQPQNSVSSMSSSGQQSQGTNCGYYQQRNDYNSLCNQWHSNHRNGNKVNNANKTDKYSSSSAQSVWR